MKSEPGPVALRSLRVSKRFGATTVLTDVDFDVRSGEVHALVGENGAGKTTLLRILSGREQPSSGEIEIEGERRAALDPAAAQRAGVAVVPQHVELIPDLSVAENIFLNRWPTNSGMLDFGRMRRESQAALAQLGVHIDPLALVRDLSYVERQMVEIARVARSEARVIIMDEPTAALSVREIRALFALVQRLKAAGLAIIYVSHFLAEIAQIADRLSIMRNGMIVSSGPAAAYDTAAIVRHMVGRVDTLYPLRTGAPLPGAGFDLQVRRRGILDLKFSVRAGELIGVAAPKGEGISAAFRALAGVQAPGMDAEIRSDGRVFDLRNTQRAQASGVGYLSEERSKWGILWGRGLRENVTISSLNRDRDRIGLIDAGRERHRAQGLLDEFLVRAPGVESEMTALSGGNQQKALIARLLTTSRPLYLLDDPTNGVDVGSKAEINRLINAVVNSGAAVVLHTADLFELIGMSDQIVVVKGGRVDSIYARGGISESGLEWLLEAEEMRAG